MEQSVFASKHLEDATQGRDLPSKLDSGVASQFNRFLPQYRQMLFEDQGAHACEAISWFCLSLKDVSYDCEPEILDRILFLANSSAQDIKDAALSLLQVITIKPNQYLIDHGLIGLAISMFPSEQSINICTNIASMAGIGYTSLLELGILDHIPPLLEVPGESAVLLCQSLVKAKFPIEELEPSVISIFSSLHDIFLLDSHRLHSCICGAFGSFVSSSQNFLSFFIENSLLNCFLDRRDDDRLYILSALELVGSLLLYGHDACAFLRNSGVIGWLDQQLYICYEDVRVGCVSVLTKMSDLDQLCTNEIIEADLPQIFSDLFDTDSSYRLKICVLRLIISMILQCTEDEFDQLVSSNCYETLCWNVSILCEDDFISCLKAVRKAMDCREDLKERILGTLTSSSEFLDWALSQKESENDEVRERAVELCGKIGLSAE